jgi:hypothetical protein
MKILLVEDEAKTAYLRKGLAEQGYPVDISRKGDGGLERARQGNYDLLTLDIMLPQRVGGLPAWPGSSVTSTTVTFVFLPSSFSELSCRWPRAEHQTHESQDCSDSRLLYGLKYGGLLS